MRLLASTLSTIALAGLLLGCGGSKKEDTTPASTEAAGEDGDAAEGEAEGPAEGEGDAEAEPAPAGGW